MALVACGLALICWRLLRGKSFQTVTGKGYSPRLIDLGPWRWLTFAICVAFFVISSLYIRFCEKL